jgi:hypothetical protein
MDGGIRLSAKQCKARLKVYRSARAARRALVLLLLDDECSYRQAAKAALASPTLIGAVKRDFQNAGLTCVLQTERRETSVAYWLIVVMRWLLSFTPQACRSTCRTTRGPQLGTQLFYHPTRNSLHSRFLSVRRVRKVKLVVVGVDDDHEFVTPLPIFHVHAPAFQLCA